MMPAAPANEETEHDKHRVVIVGAGFGGIETAKTLAGAHVHVTLLDKRNHHTFQPLLYQVATAGLDSDDICYAVRGIFHRHSNVRARQGAVVDVDLDDRLIFTEDGDPLPYDTLVLALGAVTADFGVPGVAAHAFGLKSAAEATRIRNRVLSNFERAARIHDADERAAATTVAIVGGGPTGVEMAGGFIELFDRVLRRDFPELKDQPTRVVLIEGQERLLGAFAPKLGAKAAKKLGGMGVDVRTSTQVSAVTPHSLEFTDGTELSCDTVIWAAGVRAHPIAEKLGLDTIQGGRIVVDDHLRVPGRPEVFVIGDLAATKAADGSLVPQVASAAIQGGAHVAKTLIEGADRTSAFRYRDKGSMATIGRNAAVVEFPNGKTITGFPGWVTWLALHLVMLIGFRNRANVLVNWAWNYLTWDRGSRIVVDLDDDLVSQALEGERVAPAQHRHGRDQPTLR